jgi:hypothetical protein
MKKIVLLIFLILISGCSNINQSKIDHTPIEKINEELRLFIENSDEEVYLIQSKFEVPVNYRFSLEIRAKDKDYYLVTSPLSDFQIIYFKKPNANYVNTVISLVYLPILEEYYLIDFKNRKVLNDQGKLVDYQSFFYERVLPLLD